MAHKYWIGVYANTEEEMLAVAAALRSLKAEHPSIDWDEGLGSGTTRG